MRWATTKLRAVAGWFESHSEELAGSLGAAAVFYGMVPFLIDLDLVEWQHREVTETTVGA